MPLTSTLVWENTRLVQSRPGGSLAIFWVRLDQSTTSNSQSQGPFRTTVCVVMWIQYNSRAYRSYRMIMWNDDWMGVIETTMNNSPSDSEHSVIITVRWETNNGISNILITGVALLETQSSLLQLITAELHVTAVPVFNRLLRRGTHQRLPLHHEKVSPFHCSCW